MSEITATLTKKIGPLPAWSYAVIGGGLGLLFLLKKKPAQQAAVGTGTLPAQAIGSGTGGGGDGSTGTGTGTGTGTSPVLPTPITEDAFTTAWAKAQSIGGRDYAASLAAAKTWWEGGGGAQFNNYYQHGIPNPVGFGPPDSPLTSSPITPAPTNPIFVPPQTTHITPIGPAGPVNQPAYNPSYQMPNPPLLHYIGGPLGGMNLPAQVASALSGGNGGKTLYVGGPLNGQYL